MRGAASLPIRAGCPPTTCNSPTTSPADYDDYDGGDYGGGGDDYYDSDGEEGGDHPLLQQHAGEGGAAAEQVCKDQTTCPLAG